MIGTTSRFGFPLLFFCLIALLVLPPYLAALGISGIISWLLATVLLSSLYLVAKNRRQLVIGILLALPALGLNLSHEIFDFSTPIHICYLPIL